jgi:hypothetical protein
VDLEIVARVKAAETLEPDSDRVARAPLPAEWMISWENVMHVIRELSDDPWPLSTTQQLEHRGGASPHDHVIHAPNGIPSHGYDLRDRYATAV